MCFVLHVIPPKPRIDYTLKAVGGSLTAIPGLSDMIDVSLYTFVREIFQFTCTDFVFLFFCFVRFFSCKDTVNSIITDMLQWPHRIVVPIGGIPVDTR